MNLFDLFDVTKENPKLNNSLKICFDYDDKSLYFEEFKKEQGALILKTKKYRYLETWKSRMTEIFTSSTVTICFQYGDFETSKMEIDVERVFMSEDEDIIIGTILA